MPQSTLAEARVRPASPSAPAEAVAASPVVTDTTPEPAAARPSVEDPAPLAVDLLGEALSQAVLAVALPAARVTWASAAADRLFGRAAVGSPLADLLVEAAERDPAEWLDHCALAGRACATARVAGNLVPLTLAARVRGGVATLVLSDRRDAVSASYDEARHSLERYALALRSTNDGIYDWEIEADRIFFSLRAREIFGLAAEEMSPHGWAARIHPDDYPAYRAAHVRHLRGETERFVCEYRFRAGDAGWKWVRQHGIALRRDDGRALRLTGSVGDITEMKQAEARVEHERGILAATIEHMEQGLYMADAEGCMVAFNQRFRDLFSLPEDACRVGYTVESVLRFLHGRGDLGVPWEQVRDRSLSAASRRHGHGYEIRRPDGKTLEARTTALPDGGYIRTFTDVTQRRRQERAISDILEAIPLPIIVSSPADSTVLYVNTHAQENFGLCVGAPVGGHARDLYVNSDDRRRLVDQVRARGVVDAFEVEWRALGSGAHCWVLLSAHAFTYQGRDAMLVTAADITERRRMDAELTAAKERAEHALADLQATQASLVEAEKMASLGGLVAGVAHEINTPVGITVTTATHFQEKTQEIRGIFESGKVRRSDFEAYLKTASQAADLILGSSTRAANLIQSFKQVAVDQTSEERRRFDLKTYVEEVLLSLGPRLKRTPHRVTTAIAEDIEVDGYPGPLSQVLTNFVINSLMHAWPEDGSTAGTISVSGHLEGGQVVLIYRDDGRGIPPDHLSKIFEPFFTTRRGSGGSGLGLNIVFNIVRQTMGGTVDVVSRPGEGTTFTIRFPRTAA